MANANEYKLEASDWTTASLQTNIRRMYINEEPIGPEQIAHFVKHYGVPEERVKEIMVDVAAWFTSLHAR